MHLGSQTLSVTNVASKELVVLSINFIRATFFHVVQDHGLDICIFVYDFYLLVHHSVKVNLDVAESLGKARVMLKEPEKCGIVSSSERHNIDLWGIFESK